VYVDAGSSLLNKGLTATIAIQNRLDRNGDAVADPAFNGDVAAGRCNTTAINCVPANTNNDNTLVVRALVDNTSVASQTRRVWVQVTLSEEGNGGGRRGSSGPPAAQCVTRKLAADACDAQSDAARRGV
jgi:hypothetical protein